MKYADLYNAEYIHTPTDSTHYGNNFVGSF
jgi:hypothetical protein